MFHMMNDARVMIGGAAAAIGYSGYLHSLDYARNRTQGRKPQNKDPKAPPIRIIEHADVRRMLLAQKAYAEGALALTLYCARLIDWQATALNDADAERAGLLLELLTPVCKSWPSQWCQEGNSLAIQIHGGYGYTRDFQVEQLWRDQRLNPIHEGTHGIQALDLLGRKIRLHDGAAFAALTDEIGKTLARAGALNNELKQAGASLAAAFERLQQTVSTLYAQSDLDLTLANSTAFLEAFGHAVLGWIWLEQACVATDGLNDGADGDQAAFYQGKLAAANWFHTWELPKIDPMLDALNSLDRTALDMQEDWF